MNQKDQESSQKAVVYISRIPYGFQEQSTFEFFQQFGDIEGICYPRSKKTGRSKGYMFILFSDRDVATECAKAVDDYYMFGKTLKTIVLPETHKIIQSRFQKNPKKFKFVPWKTIFQKNFNSGQTDEKLKKKIKKLLKNDENKREKFKKMGIDFQFIGYKDLLDNNQLILFQITMNYFSYFYQIFVFLYLVINSFQEQICDVSNSIFDPFLNKCIQCKEYELNQKNQCICAYKHEFGSKCEICAGDEILDNYKINCVKKCQNCQQCQKQDNHILLTNYIEGDPLLNQECQYCSENSFDLKLQNFSKCQNCYQGNMFIIQNQKCICDYKEYLQIDDLCIKKDLYQNEIQINQGNINLQNLGQIEINSSSTYNFYLQRLQNVLLKNFLLCSKFKDVQACSILSAYCSFSLKQDNSELCQLSKTFETNENLNNNIQIDHQQYYKLKLLSFSEKIESYDIQDFNFDQIECKQSFFIENILIKNLKIDCKNENTKSTDKFFTILIQQNNNLQRVPVLNYQIGEFEKVFPSVSQNKLQPHIFQSFFFVQKQIVINNINLNRVLRKLILVNSQNDQQNLVKIYLLAFYEDIYDNQTYKNFSYEFYVYQSYDQNYRKVILIVVILQCILSLIYAIFRFIFRKKNIIQKSLLIQISNFCSDLFKFTSIFYIGYFLIIWIIYASKIQKSNYQYLPNQFFENSNFVLIVIVFCGYFLHLIIEIIKQSNQQIIFLDWEKPNLENNAKQQSKIVSSWRVLTFANEFRECIIEQRIKNYFTIMVSVIIFELFKMKEFGLDNYLQKQSFLIEKISLNSNFVQNVSFIIVNLVTSLVLIILGKILDKFQGAQYENLIDLASICNVSLIIEINQNQYFYLHGKNSFNTGEGTLEIIYKKLKLESLIRGKGRGLTQNNTQQIFQIDIFGLNLTNKIDLTEQKNIISKTLKEKLQQPNLKFNQKSLLQKLFGISNNKYLNSKNDKTHIEIFNEKNNFFIQFLLERFQLDILILESLFVVIFMYIFDNIYLGLVFVFIIDHFLIQLRDKLCIKNLTKYNNIDQRFFIQLIYSNNWILQFNFFKLKYEMFCVKGINLAKEIEINDDGLQPIYDDKPIFDIPTQRIKDCNAIGNHLSIELFQNFKNMTHDNLQEIRFFVHQLDQKGSKVDQIEKMIKKEIGQNENEIICILPEVPFIVPREYMKLHGSSYNYTINYLNISKAFMLPMHHRDYIYFVMGFEQPLKQGQTIYNYAVIQFQIKTNVQLLLKMPTNQLKKIHQELEQQMDGLYFEIFIKLFKYIVQMNIVIPREFRNNSNEDFLSCIYGSKRGFIFILSKSLIFIPRPIIHIKYSEIVKVEIFRIDKKINNKGFDCEILKNDGSTYFFSAIDKKDSDAFLELLQENKIFITIAQEERVNQQDDSFVEQSNPESDDDYQEDDFIIKDYYSLQDSEIEEKEDLKNSNIVKKQRNSLDKNKECIEILSS